MRKLESIVDYKCINLNEVKLMKKELQRKMGFLTEHWIIHIHLNEMGISVPSFFGRNCWANEERLGQIVFECDNITDLRVLLGVKIRVMNRTFISLTRGFRDPGKGQGFDRIRSKDCVLCVRRRTISWIAKRQLPDSLSLAIFFIIIIIKILPNL